ncbi:hypothetical protein IID19_04305 [Patescibacteria group bacterium]|nr:hypothetical protein [Patescibacteria group bacterium]
MSIQLSFIPRAMRESLSHTKFKLIFIATLVLMTATLIIIPVLTVSGNTLRVQLDIFKPLDYFLLIFISSLYAVFITLQLYAFKVARSTAPDIGKGAAGGVGAILAGVAGTAFCASCLAPLFGLLGIGLGGTLFVLQYRFYIVALVAILMLVAIYFTSKKITRVCKC